MDARPVLFQDGFVERTIWFRGQPNRLHGNRSMARARSTGTSPDDRCWFCLNEGNTTMKAAIVALASALVLSTALAAAAQTGGLSNPGVSSSPNTGATTTGSNTGMSNDTTTG